MSDTLTINEQIILAALNVMPPKPLAPTVVKPILADDSDAARVLFDSELLAANAKYTSDLASFETTTTSWNQALRTSARDIKALMYEKSEISEQLILMDAAVEQNKVFVGTILNVVSGDKPKKAIVTFWSGSSTQVNRDLIDKDRELPHGYEQVRTDFIESGEGRVIARSAQFLVGHKALLFVPLEAGTKPGDKFKYRTLRHVADLGVDPNYNRATGVFTAPRS